MYSKIFLLVAPLLSLATAHAQVSVSMYHNDLSRTGVNDKETILTPAKVKSGKFGKIGSLKVDGQVYAQPLIISDVQINGLGATELLIIVTEHDSVYAFNTKGMDQGVMPSAPVWKRSFLGDDMLPCPNAPCETVKDSEVHAPNITPEIGITATPAIDVYRKIMYVTAMTKEAGVIMWKIHALDLRNGAEMPGSPVRFQGYYDGTGTGSEPNPNPGPGEAPTHIPFSAVHQLSRAGLVLTPSGDPARPYEHLIVTFASFNNNQPCHGWVFAINPYFNPGDLQPLGLDLRNVFMTTPNSASGNIWMAGGAPAVDAQNNIYFTTGNGEPQYANMNPPDLSDSVIKINFRTHQRSFFTPFDHVNLANRDVDFGAGGVVLLPDQPGPFPHLLLSGGKKGTLYLLNRDNMGGVDPGVTVNGVLTDSPPPLIPQALTGVIPQGPRPGGNNFGWGIYGTPAYFNGKVYTGGNKDYLRAIPLVNGLLTTSGMQINDRVINQRGITPSISSNGTSDGIVWYIDPSAYVYTWNPSGPPTTLQDGPAVLYAYDANDLSKPLFQSDINTSDTAGYVVKFATPTIANGLVFVGGRQKEGSGLGEVTIYGMRKDGNVPLGAIKVYPVPATAGQNVYVSIKDLNIGQATATVYDMLGKQITQRELDFTATQNDPNNAGFRRVWFPTSNLAAGTYIIFITDGKQKFSQKIVVAK